ncbi:flagellar hook-associated protein FlgK [Pollutimonas nitritireducens]|uniref:Flagellar hook-associated protein 1 n=1 Tax=Pollutimonas nitritireducens TaxID=2045209 RepID=A0A2N4UB38_9BURK|nr:flagellar hook-associated protein FlgK [Pollutimonas nitritireducens]PLC52225.1 flagellar hook-associated protein FlgK [Pollutimonas nitritireducens]
MNLANLGLSGLNAATNRLQTAGHNINNAATVGFNRQTVLVQTAGATSTGAGYIGRGVQAVTVQRAYDNFLSRQLVGAQTAGAALVSYGNEISQVNNLFADRTVGITPALQNFFDSIQAVASAPADSAARQEMLGRASSLVSQLNDSNAFLESQRNNINTQITTTVTQINSYVERVRDLNTQITTARATSSNHEPNDLLDQRDQLVSELSQLVAVNVDEQDGKVSLSVGNGQVLLGGDTVFPLAAQAAAADPSRTIVAFTAVGSGGQQISVEMSEATIKGGKLGGLITYRRESLDAVQNDLGRLAAGLATAVNAIHANGEDLSGAAGGAFFKLGQVKTISNANNLGGAPIAVQIQDINKLTSQNYRIDYDGTAYKATSIPNGTVTTLSPLTGGSYDLDGIRITPPTASAVSGDSWLVQPTRDAAGSIALAIDDPAKIAAATANTGTANGGVALELAQLQTGKVLGNGAMSLNEAFSQIVNKVGVQTQQNGTAAKAQAALIQQNFAAQQHLSGVNLDEEYVNLTRYQEQYSASARLIEVSSTLFDTLLGIR